MLVVPDLNIKPISLVSLYFSSDKEVSCFWKLHGDRVTIDEIMTKILQMFFG